MGENYRIGQGIDVHKFADTIDKKKPLKLAGIKVSEEYSLIAHSDGDVVLHAICDAMLGAASKGDIGYHFPNTKKKWIPLLHLKQATKHIKTLQKRCILKKSLQNHKHGRETHIVKWGLQNQYQRWG